MPIFFKQFSFFLTLFFSFSQGFSHEHSIRSPLSPTTNTFPTFLTSAITPKDFAMTALTVPIALFTGYHALFNGCQRINMNELNKWKILYLGGKTLICAGTTGILVAHFFQQSMNSPSMLPDNIGPLVIATVVSWF
jgi:hypothetical protein